MPIPPISGTDFYKPSGNEGDFANTRNVQRPADLTSGLPGNEFDVVDLAQAPEVTTGQLLSQVFGAIGNALKSGDLPHAQSGYLALQQTLQSAWSSVSDQLSTTSAVPLLAGAVRVLQHSLDSGNLSSAQQAFASIQRFVQNAGPDGTRPSATGNVDVSLQNVGAALQSGDMVQALGAWTSFQDMLQKAPSPNAARDPKDLLAQAMKNLGQALQSGNTTGAQQAYASIQDILQYAANNANRTAPDGSSQLSAAFQALRQAMKDGIPSNAQHAYWSIQQDQRNLARLLDGNLAAATDRDSYSLYLLLSQVQDHRGLQAGHMVRNSALGRIIWWIFVNLAALVFCAVVGLLPLSGESAVPVITVLLAVNGFMLVFASRRRSDSD
jgi:hypothetical protein